MWWSNTRTLNKRMLFCMLCTLESFDPEETRYECLRCHCHGNTCRFTTLTKVIVWMCFQKIHDQLTHRFFSSLCISSLFVKNPAFMWVFWSSGSYELMNIGLHDMRTIWKHFVCIIMSCLKKVKCWHILIPTIILLEIALACVYLSRKVENYSIIDDRLVEHNHLSLALWISIKRIWAWKIKKKV